VRGDGLDREINSLLTAAIAGWSPEKIRALCSDLIQWRQSDAALLELEMEERFVRAEGTKNEKSKTGTTQTNI